jgi:peptidoglycan/xylan/chitin deacetylase (PgdA/CDA1 family)
VSTFRRSLGRFVRAHSAAIGSVVSVTTPTPECVLTYDDGPHPLVTSAVQDELDAAGATATFFVLLTQARKHPEVVRETIARGHEIGLHGVDHRSLVDLPSADVRRRCVDGRAELEDIAGARVRWLRPPYGRQTLRTWRIVRAAGLEPVMWGPTLRDAVPMPTEERLARTLPSVERGSIILAHDRFATAEDGAHDGEEPDVDRPTLTRDLLEGLRAKGLAGTSLENALRTGTALRGAWFGR